MPKSKVVPPQFLRRELWRICQVEPAVVGAKVVWRVVATCREVAAMGGISGWRVPRDFTTRTEAWSAVSDANNPPRDRRGRVRTRSTEAWVQITDETPLLPRTARRARAPTRMPTPKLAQTGRTSSPEADTLRASLAERGGMWTFIGLWRGDERVPARLKSDLYGAFWELRAGIGGRTRVPAGPRSRIQRELGLHEREEVAPGVVKTRREKTDVGGFFVRAWVARRGCNWGTDAVPVTDDAADRER